MKKLLLLLLCLPFLSFGATGWYQDYVKINVNGNGTSPPTGWYWIGSNPGYATQLDGLNFGTVTSLVIEGCDMKYWSDNQDRTGGAFYYKIMSADNSTQIVAPVETVWTQSYLGGNDYQGTITVSINLFNGLAPSTTYKLHIWAKHWGSNQGDNYLSNGGNNYVATFTTPAAPVAYNVTGSGSYCLGSGGLPVGLDNSETGVTYTISPGGQTISGSTGNAVSFGNRTAGTYTVTATRYGFTTNMTGSAVITENPLPAAPTNPVNQTICSYQTIPALSVTVGTDITADWFDASTGGNLLLSGSTSYTPTAAGNYYAEARNTNTGCLSAARTTVTLTVNGCSKVTAAVGDWNSAETWSPSGVPQATDNVTINHAVTLTGNADCNDLTIGTGSLSLSPGASLINRGTVVGTADVNFSFTANEWHLISSPVSDATANLFFDRFLMYHSESTDLYQYIEPETTVLDVMKGYALWGETGYTYAAFTGTLNSGPRNIEVAKTLNGWNLLGNPYPSSIDWDAATGWIKTNVNDAVYIHKDAATWASYIGGTGANDGSRYIAPCQGFFVQASANGILCMNNDVRVHHATPFFKSSYASDNLVRLVVSGNGYRDEAVVRVKNGTTNTFDGWADAHKLYGTVDAAAQIYSLGDTPLSINSIPEPHPVSVGVKAGISGTYTIAATEINGLTNVKLEDTKTGIINDLQSAPYTFSFDQGDNENRFVLHFAALGKEEPGTDAAAIYSYENTAIVNLPVASKGNVYIYNTAGQLVASKTSVTGQVRMDFSPAGVYLVKVVTEKETLTRKVMIR